jgi:hypothetical protein
MQKSCQGRCNSVLTNRNQGRGHIDEDFAKHNARWLDTWGSRILARHLAANIFKVPDWCVDDLLVSSHTQLLERACMSWVHKTTT